MRCRPRRHRRVARQADRRLIAPMMGKARVQTIVRRRRRRSNGLRVERLENVEDGRILVSCPLRSMSRLAVLGRPYRFIRRHGVYLTLLGRQERDGFDAITPPPMLKTPRQLRHASDAIAKRTTMNITGAQGASERRRRRRTFGRASRRGRGRRLVVRIGLYSDRRRHSGRPRRRGELF